MRKWSGGASLSIAFLVSSERLIAGFRAPFTMTQSRHRRQHQATKPPSFSSASDTSGSGSSLDVVSVPSSTNAKDGKVGNAPDIFDQPVAKPDSEEPVPVRAPLVDSTLLRFLSAQKKEAFIQPLMDQSLVEDDSSSISSVADLVSDTTDTDRPMETAGGFSDGSGSVGGSLAYASWLGQYNGNVIAQQLISIGAEESDAFKAGQAVQRHILARTMRRRIRKFLRERDRVWAKGKSAEMQTTSGISLFEQFIDREALEMDQYRCEDAIALLAASGLNGKDVAAILEHTPSLLTIRTHRRETGFEANSGVALDSRAGSRAARAGVSSREGNDNIQPEETLEDLVNLIFDELLQSTLKLRRYDARAVLRSCPGLLTRRGSRSAMQVIALMKSLGVSTSSLARDKKSLPKLLSRSPAALFRFVAFLSSEDVRMPVKNIGPFLRRKNTVQLLDAVAPVLNTNRGDNLTSSGGDTLMMANFWGNDDIQAQRKRIDSLYRSMASTADILRHEFGVSSVGKMVSAFPNVLLLDVSSQVTPVVDYLCNEIGIWEEDIPRVLESFPSLLEADISRMYTVVEYMHSLDISDDSLGPMFRAFPALLTLDVEKDMKPVADFLSSIGVSNVGRFVTRLPPVLGYSVEKDLRPKWEYLTAVCRFDKFEVVRFPAYFSYPFDRVIKVRYEYLRDVKKAPILLMSVDEIVRFGDAEFARTVAGDCDGGVAFTSYVDRRQKESQGAERKRKKAMKRKKSRKQLTETISRKPEDR